MLVAAKVNLAALDIYLASMHRSVMNKLKTKCRWLRSSEVLGLASCNPNVGTIF